MEFQDSRNKLSPRKKQICPLCGEDQPIFLRGFARDYETGERQIVCDRGYSFCNCRNIFYTRWSNIKLDDYDQDYLEHVINPDISKEDKKQQLMEFEKHWIQIKNFYPNPKSFLNIGEYSDAIFDYLKSKDWDGIRLTAIDLIQRKSKYELIVDNFDLYDFEDRKFDVIYASHFIEHVKDPKSTMLKMKNLLTENGVIFVAMPDTRHIEFPSEVMNFPWIVTEHHIMWNIYDWVDFVTDEVGIECVHMNSSSDVLERVYEKGGIELSWIKEMRTIFKKQG